MHVIDPKRTGLHLRNLMEERGLTVTDVQNMLGLSCPQTVYHWICGSSLPTVDHLYSLSRCFNTTMDELLVGESLDEPSPPHRQV